MSTIDDTKLEKAGKAALDAIAVHTTDKMELLTVLRLLHEATLESVIEDQIAILEASHATAH